ncbi:MAG: ATP-binding cassette domain-containing protein [SAR116 cluster bacterium]|nr:ATP-binding cassette domain-containing protein [SAR116 cluster bacterium]
MTSDRQTSEMILSARDICLSRDGNRLLASVSVDIRRGRIPFLLGYNGAGKTLLLSSLHGLLELECGSVDAPPRNRQKMVFQKPIIMRRTAAGHLRFVCPGVAETELADWMKRAGIQDRTSGPARALSGGEQQKLALIGALATKPDILFLDEPTAHLDFAATKFVEDMIREAHAAGATIVMTTHNRSQAERLGQDVLFLDGGRLVEAAPAATFFKAPGHALTRQYLEHL